MRFAQKKRIRTKAYCLGTGSRMEELLIKEGKIRKTGEETYEVFSQEARSGEGEQARAGDYVKVDGSGFPYPISAKHFCRNHEPVEGDTYVEIPRPRAIWEYGDEMFFQVKELLDSGRLVLKEEEEEAYFQARLKGAWLTASKDAVLVFYSLEKDEEGNYHFNFVARKEFDASYDYVLE